MNYLFLNFLLSVIILLLIFLFLFLKIFLFFKRNWTKLNYLTFKANKNKYILQEIGRALENLSSKKVGASMIFERHIDVNPFLVSEGIKINSIISSDLIITIFSYKKNQLHDGAMIIDSNLKIKSVGNFLPIRETKILASSFGARHRSVYTLISMTNTVGIVVSETNGYITCFYKKTPLLKTKNVLLVLEWLKKKI